MKYYSNELYHFGILGQKWGERRYQNEDGTYTEEGKVRRRKGSEGYSDDYRRSRELSKKGYKNLSNKELQEYNNRRNLEENYKRLKQGESFVAEALAIAGTTTAVLVAANKLGGAANGAAKIYGPLLASVGAVAIDKIFDTKGLSGMKVTD